MAIPSGSLRIFERFPRRWSEEITSLTYKDNGQRVTFDKFRKGPVAGSFFLRVEAGSTANNCQVSEDPSIYILECMRGVGSGASTFQKLHQKTLADIRACSKRGYWAEIGKSSEGECSVVLLQSSGRECVRQFKRGPQYFSLFGKYTSDGKFAIGIFLVMEKRTGRSAQGEYLFLQDGRLRVTSKKGWVVVTQTYDHGRTRTR